MRLLIVQYAGDYREAYHRLAGGEPETYYAQKYTIDAVAQLTEQVEQVATLCCLTTEAYDETLQPRLQAIGAGLNQTQDLSRVLAQISAYQPTHLVLRSPIPAFIQWAIQQRIPTLLMLADSFESKSLRQTMKQWMLARWLNHPTIEWIGNHGIEASLSLQRMGVNPEKIIPWDLPHTPTPHEFAPKTVRAATERTVLYVGAVIAEKGVGDLLEAIAHLHRYNLPIRLKIAGKGDLEQFVERARQLGIEQQVDFLGLVPNAQVIPLMRQADAVVVPSRHEYAEGFPLTIYESLTARTPLITSDHPMFRRNLGYGKYAQLFEAGDAIALAQKITQLFEDPALYRHLSQSSLQVWQNLQIPVRWLDLLHRWIDCSPANQQWLTQHRLSSGLYAPATEEIAQTQGWRSVLKF